MAEANALPSGKRTLLIVVPSILSAETMFPAVSTTTAAAFKFWLRANATAPSMMTRASASEISGGGKAGGGGGAAAGAWARPGCPDANNSSRPRIAIVCDDAGRRNFMRSSLCVQQIHTPRIRRQVPRCIDHAADQEAGLVRAIAPGVVRAADNDGVARAHQHLVDVS